MKALALCLLLALPANAAPDAPGAVAVDAGYITPSAGVFLPAPLDVQAANRLQVAESRPGWPVVLLGAAGGLVVGALVTGIVAAYVKK